MFPKTRVRAFHIKGIRKRPGMYLGGCNAKAIEHMAGEVIANSIDQFLVGKATRIRIRLRGSAITVSDDGPGFHTAKSRLPRAEHYLTHLHSTPTADGHAPHVHLTYSGYGLVIVNALSSALILRSHGSGRVTEVAYCRGRKIASKSGSSKRADSGLSITFTPDPEIFGSYQVRRHVLRSTLFHAVHLFPGLRIHFESERFYAPGGLGDLTALFSNGTGPFFNASVAAGPYLIHASATGRGDLQPQWMSWVNGVLTVAHGTHVQGFREALRKAGWAPDCAAIHIIMLDPRYAGPTKDKLGNGEVGPAVKEALLPLIQAALQKQER